MHKCGEVFSVPFLTRTKQSLKAYARGVHRSAWFKFGLNLELTRSHYGRPPLIAKNHESSRIRFRWMMVEFNFN